MYDGRRGCDGGVRRGHEGPDVLHLPSGRPSTYRRGSCARVRVPYDRRLCARVVLGGAGEDFGGGGRGEQFGLQGEEREVETMAHVQLVQATLPWRRALRARVGVLEDIRRAAGNGRGSAPGDLSGRERFIRVRPLRGRVVRKRGRPVYDAAHWRIRRRPAYCAGQSCEHVSKARTT